MGNEMTIFEGAAGVSNALSTVLQTYNLFRSTRKKEMLQLSLSLEQYKREAIARGESSLVRINIEEIIKTQRYIDESQLTGVALDLAMDQLRHLNEVLKDNLDAYRSF